VRKAYHKPANAGAGGKNSSRVGTSMREFLYGSREIEII